MMLISVSAHAEKNEYSASSITVHDSFVDRELSIHVMEWSGTEWRQGGNSDDIDEVIVARPRRERRTKK